MQIEDTLKEDFILNFHETMNLRKKILPEDDYLMSTINEFWERIGITLLAEKTTINKYHFKILDKKKLAWAIIQYNLDIFP